MLTLTQKEEKGPKSKQKNQRQPLLPMLGILQEHEVSQLVVFLMTAFWNDMQQILNITFFSTHVYVCVCVRVCARAVFMLSCQHHPCPLVLEAPILEEAGRSQEAQALDHSLLISHWSSSPLGPFSLGSNCPEDS